MLIHILLFQRARDLFYALWIPDLFMERVEADLNWSLMCPSECPGLQDCWGKEFNELYTKYEKQGKFRKQVRAQKLWFAILDAQTETGTPYMMYKDACNRKSNQQVWQSCRRGGVSWLPYTEMSTQKKLGLLAKHTQNGTRLKTWSQETNVW